jgi:hypothetical protein
MLNQVRSDEKPSLDTVTAGITARRDRGSVFGVGNVDAVYARFGAGLDVLDIHPQLVFE